MPVKNFKFVSPGVFINEIDNSFRPRQADSIGPVVLGRSTRGLAMQPVKVESYSDFVTQFGGTVPGNGGGDIYRDGNYQSPMYGTYAAKAFLNANVAPLTFVRLLGQQTTTNDGTADSQAGWKTAASVTNAASSNGGAYGLWVAPSGSSVAVTGTLAAIFYLDSGYIQLSGTYFNGAGGNATTGAAGHLITTDSDGLFTLEIYNASSVLQDKVKFDFDDSAETFIRKRLNTNPQLMEAGDFYPAASEKTYWLGETFEQELRDGSDNSLGDLTTSNNLFGIVLALTDGTRAPSNMKDQASCEGTAGWFIGQDLGVPASFAPADKQKLFRLLGRGHGEWLHKNAKVSIEKIRQSSTTTSEYGTFSIVIRDLRDTDNNVVVLERFDSLTLDPTSPDYIARRIGDRYYEWDTTERRLKEYGDYPNQSRYVRVEMNSDVDAGATDAVLLPFGYFGPPRYSSVTGLSGSGVSFTSTFVTGGLAIPTAVNSSVLGSSSAATASLLMPSVRLRVSASDGGLSDPTNAYFGMMSTRTSTSTRADASIADPHKLLYAGFPDDPTATSPAAGVDSFSYVFSLNDVTSSTGGAYYYESGSRVSAASAGRSEITAKTLIDAGYNRFTAPFWGGFDGFDITKPDPLYNNGMAASATEDTSYAYHTIRRAIDTVADPEFINMNLLTMPGLTNAALTTHMINVCEDRADAMALIDLPSVYIPPHEQYYADRSSRIGTTPKAAATALKDRRIDSSYGATFYPWVQTRDENNGQLVWIPPTVAMMGVLASSERSTQVWFAPAGFNRGGLTDGAAGIPVSNVTERLTSKSRDVLYEARINPIASFPNTGIVVFGQKTLQERPSALDRINVRRLVIYLKKQISILSSQVLFEQNVQATWTRFKSLIEPFLANVKTEFGITDYRLILDETTTTPDLIDQNVVYAKIMIKPARAIEFIAIDFVVASTGASFDD
jgi:hypothetical protein